MFWREPRVSSVAVQEVDFVFAIVGCAGGFVMGLALGLFLGLYLARRP